VWKCATPLMRTFVTDLLLMWCTVCRMWWNSRVRKINIFLLTN
jgi:hypothetical protein